MMGLKMPTCAETPTVKHRPKLRELPEWFRKAGGNLQILGKLLGGYSAKQIRRWINEAHPAVKAELESELDVARADAKRGKKVRDDLPAALPLSEVRHLFSAYYRTPWDELIAVEQTGLNLSTPEAVQGFALTGGSKSKSLIGRPNPSTGQTLAEQLSWADNREIAQGLNEADEHVMMDWVGLGSTSPLALRIKAMPIPVPPPKATARQKEDVLRQVYKDLAPKLIRQPEKLLNK
jgi:hypothetical protein